MDVVQLYYANFELHAAITLGWPMWVARSVIILCLGIGIAGSLQLDLMTLLYDLISGNKRNNNDLKISWKFRKFQLSYLIVYLLIMLADWLQGTNMYTLYAVSSMYLL